MTVVATPMWPNVTNKLQDDNDGDCEAVLGEDCVRALLAQPSYKRSGACAVPTVQQLDACQGVFKTGSFQITGSRKSIITATPKKTRRKTALPKTQANNSPPFPKHSHLPRLLPRPRQLHHLLRLQRRRPEIQHVLPRANPRWRERLVPTLTSQPGVQCHRCQAGREPTPRHAADPAWQWPIQSRGLHSRGPFDRRRGRVADFAKLWLG
jgi:hypothetical protein